MAEVFEKKHYYILKTIDNIIKSQAYQEDLKISIPKFEEQKYKNRQGNTQRKYTMTKNGFALLAMSFHGEKALQFKLTYINRFDRMETILRNMSAPDWIEERQAGITSRIGSTDMIQSFIDLAIEQGSSGYSHYYSHYTRMVYKALFGLTGKIPANFRNSLPESNLEALKLAEKWLANELELEIADGTKFYKDIFRSINEKLKVFCDNIRFLIEEKESDD